MRGSSTWEGGRPPPLFRLLGPRGTGTLTPRAPSEYPCKLVCPPMHHVPPQVLPRILLRRTKFQQADVLALPPR